MGDQVAAAHGSAASGGGREIGCGMVVCGMLITHGVAGRGGGMPLDEIPESRKCEGAARWGNG